MAGRRPEGTPAAALLPLLLAPLALAVLPAAGAVPRPLPPTATAARTTTTTTTAPTAPTTTATMPPCARPSLLLGPSGPRRLLCACLGTGRGVGAGGAQGVPGTTPASASSSRSRPRPRQKRGIGVGVGVGLRGLLKGLVRVSLGKEAAEASLGPGRGSAGGLGVVGARIGVDGSGGAGGAGGGSGGLVLETPATRPVEAPAAVDATLRPARARDILWMKHLNEKYLPENYPLDFWKQTIQRWPSISFVCELSDGQIIGYVLGKMEQTYAYSSHHNTIPRRQRKNEGKIMSICVRHEWRGKGVGKQLLNAVVEAMDTDATADFVSLRVRQNTNPNAVALYEKMSFNVEEVVKNYYRDGEGALLMTRQLR